MGNSQVGMVPTVLHANKTRASKTGAQNGVAGTLWTT